MWKKTIEIIYKNWRMALQNLSGINKKNQCLPVQRQVIQLHAQRSTEMLEADAGHGVEAALQ